MNEKNLHILKHLIIVSIKSELCFLTAASYPKKDFYTPSHPNPPPPKNVQQTLGLHTQNSVSFVLRTQKSIPKSRPKKVSKKMAKRHKKKAARKAAKKVARKAAKKAYS